MTSERITAPLVKKALDDHLQKHELRIDPKLHDVHEAVFGKGNIGGLCDEVKELQGIYKTLGTDIAEIKESIYWVIKIVLGAVILGILGLVIIP